MLNNVAVESVVESFIKFESSQKHYRAEACIVWCYDARFADLYNYFLLERGFSESKVDAVKGAGGAQALAGEAGADRVVAESQIAKSIKLHHAERVILMMHEDCGAYGGTKAFGDDVQVELGHHLGELRKAADFVRATFPELKEIECWMADFDGMQKIDF
jgi:hypothetical protein